MTYILSRIALLSASLMLLAIPVLAEESSMDRMINQEQQGGKNECLLVSRNCMGEADTSLQRIEKLENEIRRGTDVYTNDELKSLRRQLEEEQKFMENITHGG